MGGQLDHHDKSVVLACGKTQRCIFFQGHTLFALSSHPVPYISRCIRTHQCEACLCHCRMLRFRITRAMLHCERKYRRFFILLVKVTSVLSGAVTSVMRLSCNRNLCTDQRNNVQVTRLYAHLQYVYSSGATNSRSVPSLRTTRKALSCSRGPPTGRLLKAHTHSTLRCIPVEPNALLPTPKSDAPAIAAAQQLP
jgi:hypothetical protein